MPRLGEGDKNRRRYLRIVGSRFLVNVCICYIYIYMYTHRDMYISLSLSLSLSIYIYIYTYVYTHYIQVKSATSLWTPALEFDSPPESNPLSGRFPKFHRVFLGRDPGTLKSDIVSKKTSTTNLFGFETLKLKIRRLKLWNPTEIRMLGSRSDGASEGEMIRLEILIVFSGPALRTHHSHSFSAHFVELGPSRE